MKTTNLLKAIAAVSLLTVFSCAKETEIQVIPDNPQEQQEQQEQPAKAKTYSMSQPIGVSMGL